MKSAHNFVNFQQKSTYSHIKQGYNVSFKAIRTIRTKNNQNQRNLDILPNIREKSIFEKSLKEAPAPHAANLKKNTKIYSVCCALIIYQYGRPRVFTCFFCINSFLQQISFVFARQALFWKKLRERKMFFL